MGDMLERIKDNGNPKKWSRKAPSIKGATKKNRGRNVPTKPSRSETSIQSDILRRAEILGIPLWRQQAGMVFVGASPMHLAPKGAADLTGYTTCGDAKRLEVEVKTPVGKQSAHQKEWEQVVTKGGCIYLVVRSADGFEEAMREQRPYNYEWKHDPYGIGKKYYDMLKLRKLEKQRKDRGWK